MNEEVRQGGCHVSPTLLFLLLAMWVAFVIGTAIAQPGVSNMTPQEIISRLGVTVSEGMDEETEALVTALQASGETAMPAITVGLAEGEQRLRYALIRVLGGIPGDASTSLLIEVVAAGYSPVLTSRALAALENREIGRELSADESGSLATVIRQADVVTAGVAARVLGKSRLVTAQERLMPIAERFAKEILSPSPVGLDPTSYLSPRVRALNQFLLAVSYIGKEGISALEQNRQKATGGSELEKWWVLAIGMAGGESVAAPLADMALGEHDIYIRWAAVHAYARSAKLAAIPLLTSLLTDRTESEYGDCHRGPVLLISLAAKDELWRLQHHEVSSAKSQTGVAAPASGKTRNAKPDR